MTPRVASGGFVSWSGYFGSSRLRRRSIRSLNIPKSQYWELGPTDYSLTIDPGLLTTGLHPRFLEVSVSFSKLASNFYPSDRSRTGILFPSPKNWTNKV